MRRTHTRARPEAVPEIMSDDIYFAELPGLHLYDGLEEDVCTGEELLIPGPSGPLQALTSCPACYQGTNPVAIVCHPHPLYGGSMSNKVVHILAETFNEMGLLSVTFNFRGVGKSVGRFDKGIGETEDLLAVVNWVRERYPGAPIWLAGFSFGAYVAARACVPANAERLLLVAPPVTMFDFSSVDVNGIPWMVIQGGKDEITAPEAVSRWACAQPNRPEYHWMAEADHFFHGRMNRLRDTLMKSWAPATAG